MLQAIRQNMFTAVALITIPCGYYIGTELRERRDANKVTVQSEEDVEKLKQQLEQLREEREMVLSKIKK
ncbi:hypothetical protein G6F56_005693 [Rhizopus delemar]|nr:hypothetical protein G6F56_005693 [Rhizopus delemar]